VKPTPNAVPGTQTDRSSVPTPVLVIDIAVLDQNIALMADFVARARMHLRPHAKSHKCVEIARRQVAAGAIGISCATLDELGAMVAGQVQGLLLTSPIAGRCKLARLEQQLRHDPTIMLVADDPAGIAELAALAAKLSTRLQVLLDIDVGQQRTGVAGSAAAVDLARQIAANSGLEFCGLQAYAGHIQHIVDRGARLTAVTAVADHIRELRDQLAQWQLWPRVVTGAGTGTAAMDATMGIFTELQAGSYVFMDVDYLTVADLEVTGKPSLFVDTTVVSAQWEDHVTTDAGTKAFALNGPPPVPATDEDGWTYSYDGDEFGRISLAPSSRRPARGERIAFLVSHCDPTVALYQRYVCVRGERIDGYWPIVARGSSE
jgi:D-serine deaminase-like pyridoxal phosphate-dependent protein